MRYNQLGNSDLKVSEICLGTMTFGEQNSLADAHQQLDYALEVGINFIDTAEMYPVPPKAATQGLTETYIGEWLKTKQRDRIILATKVIGAGRNFPWIRGGSHPALTKQNIHQALEDSLRRLQTDYIDLYQIHWPDRYVPMFGQTSFEPSNNRAAIPIEEQLTTFQELIQAGKIRYLGVSNETPWGVAEFSRLAKHCNLPKIISIQNAYNLLNRVFENGLAEVCYREQVGLLAYSPLAFGMLTGKYLHNGVGRLSLYPQFGQRYHKVNVPEATQAYVELAHRYGLKPSHLALAFVRSRWFTVSTIIGATTMSQLQENIDSLQVQLDENILKEIDGIHQRYPNPAP
ncbi:MAG: NADP(H)-dependent aldo-keto reductase [Pseudanabaenaceae cyanobacterium]